MADSCGAPVDGAEALMPRKWKTYDRGKTCVKCKDRTGVLVVRHAVYCKECFFPLTTFKFRRTLEPAINAVPDGPRKKALAPAGNLALAFSGGLSSAVLLDVVHASYFAPAFDEEGGMRGGRDHPRNDPTRVWKRTVVVYVEVAAAHPGVEEQIDEVEEIVRSRPHFEFQAVRIEDAFDPAWWAKVSGSPSSDPELHALLSDDELPLRPTPPSPYDTPLARLHAHLGALPSPTAVQTRIADLVRLLLHYTARAAGASHLLLGTSLSALSVSLIAGIAAGGGFAVREALAEEWFPASSPAAVASTPSAAVHGLRVLRVLRPLRDVSAKELAFWAHAARLRVLARVAPPPAAERAQVGGLARAFVRRLDAGFPSTVSAIARTCAKLAPRGDAELACVLCERPAQASVRAWKARTAIRRGPGAPTEETEAEGRALAPHLCYACHTALTSRSARGGAQPPAEAIPLPVWASASLALRSRDLELDEAPADGLPLEDKEDAKGVGEEVWSRREVGRAEMKEQIGEFLLDE